MPTGNLTGHPARGARFLMLALLLTGCASLVTYRDDPVRLQGEFTSIENYSSAAIDPAEVDALLLRVAQILGAKVNPAVPKVRIVVTSPERIARLYRDSQPDVHAVALYFPGISLILIPYFDLTFLAHELAHYITDHYLGAPRAEWEDIADRVVSHLFGPRRAIETDR